MGVWSSCLNQTIMIPLLLLQHFAIAGERPLVSATPAPKRPVDPWKKNELSLASDEERIVYRWIAMYRPWLKGLIVLSIAACSILSMLSVFGVLVLTLGYGQRVPTQQSVLIGVVLGAIYWVAWLLSFIFLYKNIRIEIGRVGYPRITMPRTICWPLVIVFLADLVMSISSLLGLPWAEPTTFSGDPGRISQYVSEVSGLLLPRTVGTGTLLLAVALYSMRGMDLQLKFERNGKEER